MTSKEQKYLQVFQNYCAEYPDSDWCSIEDEEEQITLGKWLSEVHKVAFDENILTALTCVDSTSTAGTDTTSSVNDSGGAGIWSNSNSSDCTSARLVLGNNYSAWLKFDSVSIPAGASIGKAWIEFTSLTDSTSGNFTLTIKGHDKTPTDIDCTSGLSPATTTGEIKNWYITESWTYYNVYDSANISCVVQSIVDGTAWSSGSDMTFILSSSSGNSREVAYGETKLRVYYTDATGGSGYGGYGGSGCESYDCSSSPCGCTFDCTSPNVASGNLVTSQVDSTNDNGFYACNSYCSMTEDILIGDYNPVSLWSGSSDIYIQSVYGHAAKAWLKFNSISIPKNDANTTVVINKAYLTLTASQTTNTAVTNRSVAANITMECGSTVTVDCNPSGSERGPSAIERLAGSIPWTLTDWTVDTEYDTPDLACLVQEKISSDDWTSGDDMLFLILTDSTSTDGDSGRYSYNYDTSSGTKAAQLTIYYQTVQAVDATGGVVVGGSAVDSVILNNSATGGVVVGGAAVDSLIGTQFSEDGTGGVVAGGLAVDSISYNEMATGGVVAGGVALEYGNEYSSFTYRVSITVPAGAVDEDLELFYLGIETTLDTSHVFYGNDFEITDSSGNKIYHELRSYNNVTGQVHIFFHADLLADSDNVFYLEYGGVI